MKHILFPTDFTEVSLNAYGFTLEIATQIHADVSTLHTYLPTATQPEIEFPFTAGAVDLINTDRYEEAVELLHSIARKEHHENISVKYLLEEGYPVETILYQAEKINASAIVMGTRGSHGIGAALLGSTSTSVVSKATIPVFVIPGEYDGTPLKKMGFGMNLLAATSSDIDRVLDLATILELPLTCFHIDYDHSPKLIGKIDNLKEQYSDKVTFDVFKHAYIMDGISEYVNDHDIDLLVMQTRKHSFIHNLLRVSYTKQMTLHSHVPVCILKK